MLKPTIHISIEGEQVTKYMPHRARHLIKGSFFAGEKIDLVSFPYDSSKIVTSAAIKKVLSKISRKERVFVVVGWDFTIEARQILDELEVIVLSDRYFGWTDERWSAIKQMIASK